MVCGKEDLELPEAALGASVVRIDGVDLKFNKADNLPNRFETPRKEVGRCERKKQKYFTFETKFVFAKKTFECELLINNHDGVGWQLSDLKQYLKDLDNFFLLVEEHDIPEDLPWYWCRELSQNSKPGDRENTLNKMGHSS